jgi:uncharacterized protein YndB with AHSA1/START domain
MTAERPPADGTVEQEPDESTTIRFDRRLRHPIERVWQALTDPGELRRWWGDTKLELVEGGPFQLRWRNTDEHGDVATLDGTITSIDPPRLLEISADWGSTAPGQPGTRTHLTWRLEPDGDHTLLHFTNTVEAPDQDVPTAAGWHLHLDALASILAGDDVDIAHPEALFAPIHQAYTEKYGPGPEPSDDRTPQAPEADPPN